MTQHRDSSSAPKQVFEFVVGCAQIVGTVIGIIALIISFIALVWAVRNPNAVPQIINIISGDATATPIIVVPPTNTPFPTYTPLPTYTPFVSIPPTATLMSSSPTPTLQLPFSDNFDRSIKSEWRIIQGQPLVADGRLSSVGSSNDRAVLEIGDSLTDYTAEFDFEILPNAHYVGFIIGRQIRFTGNEYCCGKWESFSNGGWNFVLDGSRNGFGSKGRAQVIVSGSTYSLFINGQLISEITYGTPSSGPFAIIVDYRTFIDNFEIKLD